MQIELDKDAQNFLQREIEAGHYRDANELISTALSHLEREQEDEKKWAALDRALEEGFNSPIAPEGTMDRIFERIRNGTSHSKSA